MLQDVSGEKPRYLLISTCKRIILYYYVIYKKEYFDIIDTEAELAYFYQRGALMNIYFGENIKSLRKTKGLTQEEFANSIGVSFQTVSKWERGDSYPDITILPIISEYFETTVDALLGIDKSKREQKVNEYITMYSELRLKERKIVLEEFEKAVREFPHDYRIAVRYMELLMEENFHVYRKDFENVSKKIETLFRKIQDNCTDDAIRIWAKRLICRYLHYKYDCCGFDENYYNQAMEIIDTMPSLSDSKELLSMEHAVLSNWDKKHEDAIEELLYHLQNTLIGYCLSSDKFPVQYKINVITHMNELFKIVDSDDRYSKNRIHMIYAYGRLGLYYFEIGDNKNSIKNLTLAAKYAIEFDRHKDAESIYRYYECENEFKKKNMSARMKELFTVHYPLSEEFKETEEFKKVLSLFDND